MPGQLLVSLSIISIGIILLTNKNEEYKIKYFYLSLYLIIFAITTKLIYSIYFIIPMIVGIKFFGFKKLLIILCNKKFLLLSTLSALIFMFYNFTSSGMLRVSSRKNMFFFMS